MPTPSRNVKLAKMRRASTQRSKSRQGWRAIPPWAKSGIGIVGGALIAIASSFATTFWTTYLSGNNEQQVFLREQRVVAYSEFVNALITEEDVTAIRLIQSQKSTEDQRAAAQVLLKERERELDAKQSILEIVGSVAARDAAFIVANSNRKVLATAVHPLPVIGTDDVVSDPIFKLDETCRITYMRDYFIEVSQTDFGNPSIRSVDARPICDDLVESKTAP
ncbi:hypothetical protein MT349_02520 [Rathayibacter caricis]|uniref:hypothetical protein n=1 Tax=Rathayibacter caricis TaxID=110936 RepID=UPI001FB3AC20|nr:hypothetical protein [Rathayibacter caricis]MCJ1694644.1 hypothetical protein [Rathayibacter caricis]